MTMESKGCVTAIISPTDVGQELLSRFGFSGSLVLFGVRA